MQEEGPPDGVGQIGASSAASLTLGSVGLMMTGLAPLATGALHRAGALTAAEIGLCTTAEFLAMGLAAGLTGLVLPTRHLHRVAGMAALAGAMADLVSPHLSHGAEIVCRLGAGFGEGVLVWLTIAFIARQARPEKLAALFMVQQVLAQLVMTLIISLLLAPTFGTPGLFAGLAATKLIALFAAPFSPDRLAPLSAGEQGAGPPAVWGLAALAVMFLFSVGTVGVFAYLEPIAAAGGLGDRAVGDALTGSLVGQLTGSGLAVILAGRVRYPAAFIAAAVCTLGAWAVFLHPPSILAFALASSVTGLGGLFLTPFFVPMSLAADPTRRTATMVGGAQLLGAATGPVLAAPISEHAPLILAAGSLCVSLSLTGALCLHFLLTKHQKEVAP